MRVAQSLEQTKAGLRFKAPKTKGSRRTIVMSSSLVEELQKHRAKQAAEKAAQEAAGGVFFLCSPWSNYVHGQTLNITGGMFSGMTT